MALTTDRLGLATLRCLPQESRPLLRPGTVPAGIVHLGVGAFHRAHQAVHTEAAVGAAGGDWGIIGVAPRSTGVVDALAAQDCLFSVTALAAEGAATRVVGALAGVRHAASDPDAVAGLLADPAIRVVTLTVTEKAYRLDPVTAAVTVDADLTADLTTGRPPRTVPGLLVRGLLARAAADAGPIALVSCDNLPSNGRRLRGLVEQCLALARVPDATAERVLTAVTCPGTMVDRIVPASTDATRDTARRALGVTDLAAVAAEPWSQWVIEDDFPGGRPAWERSGAILTGDAGPWERLKLRALNGVHSATAYLGALAGAETVAEALTLPHLEAVLRRLVTEEIAPSFTPPPGVDVADYGEQVLARFGNPTIRHRTWQVAMDGSQKLPQRVLHTVADLRAAGRSARWSALVVAAWLRFLLGYADDGRPLPLDDPLADRLRAALAAGAHTPAGVVDAVFALREVFPAGLAADDEFRADVTGWLTALERHGVRATLADAR
ncbi:MULTISPECIES: mannitol dehydrogenase family protein [unclassified Micromonospora]|uniref:mannitol dehydrogenase family protein n=1 Tax=unclassified Micromonospora TaxID=2617518 RepID=UPI001C225EE3|nr:MULTISPECIES: mannitol dehydrogenase family protein [unclassified Micromonospora]MBU8861281.1 mannitol dehydrogenase family protein [Micromonospora sp. WMMB482]MDM4780832.1 mannitol dehydrogenase family protein [Micromonospora sp. b486]